MESIRLKDRPIVRLPGGRDRGRRRGSCEIVTETDTRYLDEDGDGLLDAAEVIESLVAVGREFRTVLSTRRVILSAVGDDGEPHEIRVEPA